MAFLHEHLILPLSDLIRGEQVYKYLRLLRVAEDWDGNQLKAFQKDRLQKLLVYVSTEVPFYHDWFHTHGLNPDTITLDQLPVVNKELMRQEGIERFSAMHFPDKERMATRSGGSTGEPFSILFSAVYARQFSSISIGLCSEFSDMFFSCYPQLLY